MTTAHLASRNVTVRLNYRPLLGTLLRSPGISSLISLLTWETGEKSEKILARRSMTYRRRGSMGIHIATRLWIFLSWQLK